MKFGKYIAKQSLDIPEYAASLVNYKALKKLIKSLAASRVTSAAQAASSGISNAPGTEPHDPQATLQANKATFFFRLERELEKVNAFYLQKEAELKLRLKTLLDKKKAMQSRSGGTNNKVSATYITLQEGFLLFQVDLNKLQQFVDLNATAFSKILKKWDKSSKSRTKELYLSRAVEVQPCFNRDIITELSDLATTGALELEAWGEGENIAFAQKPVERMIGEAEEPDTDGEILKAVITDNTAILQEWLSRLQSSPDARDRITRVFLAAIPEASDQALQMFVRCGLIYWRAKDEINERNCLHEAAIAGKYNVLELGLVGGADPNETDVYGRNPLHYACMHGRLDMIQRLVTGASAAVINVMDHDNFTPLIHAINNNQPLTVRQLIASGARVQANGEQDHVPLNLACQNGLVEITELLLKQRPRIQVDAGGLYPQHHVARSGHSAKILLMLKDYGANIDEVDKLNQWTAVFHAASEGHVECLKALLDWGARVDIMDENGLSAMYYAAWEGHLECMQMLSAVRPGLGVMGIKAAKSSPSPTPVENQMAIDSDGIPDLSLPPPIIPLRRYGHNFLDKKTLVQLVLQEHGAKPIQFFQENKYPIARLTISSKSTDIIPRNVMLPLSDDSKSLAFQVDGIESFVIDFDIFPTFGSKFIARTVALPSTFTTTDAGHCTLPLFDPRLRAIGKLSFDYQIIKPFQGVPLEIAHFATYWKATTKIESHAGARITGSSLSGEYVRLFVQLTSDLVPVLYPHWTVEVAGLDVPISSITAPQFISIGVKNGMYQQRQNLSAVKSAVEAYGVLGSLFLTLEEALKLLPLNIHVDLNIAYPSGGENFARVIPQSDLNSSVDSVLSVVFESARALRTAGPESVRGVMFSSYNMNICTALNWKQPNYPVFYCNGLGDEHIRDQVGVGFAPRRSVSIKEAVAFASSNNLMGIICSSKLLALVPALIQSVKEAGLVVVAHTCDDSTFRQVGVDGVLRKGGVLKFEETIDI
ncbi:ankyrin repeat protein [Terfezia boudieri ATCC MYA-4762]|uniref:Ankyrin repeat protein n=1 Tax=Terfezia boudieri ATCC MYA-4762 TaxID=1051890 RepID=A0A3N4M0E4_9PEZI|nr:ankyrin repeat protein [Terfezia boudieri ATCC MYA-4762]